MNAADTETERVLSTLSSEDLKKMYYSHAQRMDRVYARSILIKRGFDIPWIDTEDLGSS